MRHIRKEREVADGAGTNGDDLDGTEFRHVHLERGMDLVTVSLFKARRATIECRGKHLVRRPNKQRVRRAALRKRILHRRLQHRLGKRAIRTRHWSRIGGQNRSSTARAELDVSGDPATHATRLTRDRGRASVKGRVLEQRVLNVLLEFLALLQLLVVDLIRSASRLDSLLGVGDDELNSADLGVVADTCGRVDGREGRYVVTFDLCVCTCRTERIGLPFRVSVFGGLLGEAREEGCFGGADVVDQVAQVFTIAFRLVGLKGSCRCCHGS